MVSGTLAQKTEGGATGPDWGRHACPLGKESSCTYHPSVGCLVCIWILVSTDLDIITWRIEMLSN